MIFQNGDGLIFWGNESRWICRPKTSSHTERRNFRLQECLAIGSKSVIWATSPLTRLGYPARSRNCQQNRILCFLRMKHWSRIERGSCPKRRVNRIDSSKSRSEERRVG